MPGTAGTDRRGLVAVARVAKAHGIRGELCMDVHADSLLLFAPGITLYLAAASPTGKGQARPRPYEIASARAHTDRIIVTLKGVADRNAAEALRGAEVFLSEADLPPPDEGEEYLHRLLGCQVFLGDESPVGVFEAILDTPGQLTWVIRAPNGREILFPAVPEFLLGLDPDNGTIHIDPPEGLLELYLEGPDQSDAPDESGTSDPAGKPARPPRPAQSRTPAGPQGPGGPAPAQRPARPSRQSRATRPARPGRPGKPKPGGGSGK